MRDNPIAASFVEHHPGPGERPIYARVSGGYWDTVFIQVPHTTYVTDRFSTWLRDEVFGRLRPGGDVRIAILNGPTQKPPADN